MKFINLFNFFQNPPWQYIETTGTEITGTPHGVVIDILNEMSKKLNFTYVLHLTSTSSDTNVTDEMTNMTVSW